ncbi:MAG: universal stress protein [Syntrophobacteraceae bacterium]
MKKILVAVDGTERGLEAASILGRLLKEREDLKLVLLHCVQQVATLLPGDLCLDVEEHCKFPSKDQERVGRAVLDESLLRLTAAGFAKEKVELRLKLDSMDPAQDIMNEADKEGIATIALGRRGRSQVENLLLGSISGKVAQYAREKTVWIVDVPVNETRTALIAMEGVPESREMASYAADLIAPCAGFSFTLLHLMPPVPPTFWDDGHILGNSEHKNRQSRIEKWKSEWRGKVEKYMDEGRDLLAAKGIGKDRINAMVLPTREGIARDLLNEIQEHKFHVVVMGKKSFHERKPFLMGSHASKVLQNAKATVLCLVD